MNKRALTMAAVAAIATVTLAACGSDDSAGTTAGGGASSSSSDSATPGSSGTAAVEHNDADVTFAQMMIPHHAQAIGMSEMVLAKDGVAEPVLELAEQIKSAQGPEIAQMTGWLEGWGEDVPDMGDMGDMSGMNGMMSMQDMKALRDADGEQASRLFLEQMIQHHEGAIKMSSTYQDLGMNDEALELAQTIIDAQNEEIATMEDMLATL